MKCFYHKNAQAVGICKECGKGICKNCAVDLEKGLACKGRCEESVKQLIEMIEANKENYKRAFKQLSNNVVIYFSSGTVFIFFGILTKITELRYFLLATGSVFVVNGIRMFKRK